jgi:PAS domain S-box-containing protein
MRKKTNRRSEKFIPGSNNPLTPLKYWLSIINDIDDAVVIISRDLQILYVNEAAVCQLRLGSTKIMGQHCYEVLHNALRPCESTHHKCPARELWQSGKTAQAVHIHHDGIDHEKNERYFEVKALPIKSSQGNISEAILVIRDITETERVKQRILEANRNLAALNTITYSVSQSLELDTILNSTLDKLLDVMRIKTGGILLPDSETQTLSYRTYRGFSREFARDIADLGRCDAIRGIAVQEKKPVCVDDISKDSRFSNSIAIREGVRAFASVPIMAKGKALGTIDIASPSPQRFNPQDIQLLVSVSHQVAIALENSRLYHELQRKDGVRGDLLNFIITTQEEERKRIARGLHDEISQALTSLAVNLEAVAEALPLDTDQVKARLKQIQSIAIRTLDEIHKVIWELRPTLLDDLGLTEAVEWLAETNLEAMGVTVNLETVGVERRLPNKVETALFRIIQEAITNISRHAEAESASISLEFEDDYIAVHIEDDGQGFDFDKAIGSTRTGRGLGLLSMRERVELLSGMLDIRSQLGQGTQINIQIPVNWKETPNV